MRARIATLLALAAAAPAAAAAAAQQATRLNVAPTSRIEILGTSNIHDWSCSTTKFETTIEVPGTPAREIGTSAAAVSLTIPVKEIGCERRGMAGNLQKAMNAERTPSVRFRMTGYQAAPQGGAYAADIKGVLSINGVDRPVDLTATVTPDGKGNVRAVGSYELRTPDYGVAPVTALFGRIRTGETVTIRYEIVATQAQLVALMHP